MPVAVAKIAQVARVATASAPGRRARARCMDRNSFSIRLARSTRYPMKTNSGIEIRESLVIVAYVRCTIRSSVCPMERPASALCM
ncbi:hypothetical protein D3C71_1883470 [compost metagenome]